MADRPESARTITPATLPVTVLTAYLATEYRVHLRKRPVTVRIGDHHPQLDKALHERDWQLITPCNPGTRPLPAAENARRVVELQTLLDAAGAQRLPTVNVDPGGRWPDEPGWLAAGLAPARAIELARYFGQDALVAGRAGGAAELWLISRGAAAPLPPNVIDHSV